MRRTLFLFAIAAAGCEKTDTLYCQMHPDDHANCPNNTTDAHVGSDATVYMDAPAQPVCIGTGVYMVCVPMPGSPKTITSGTVIDTTPGIQGSPCLPTQPDGWINNGQPASCFIVGTDVTIGDITAIGPRPLVFVATGTITATGTIDVASHAAVTGAGSPASTCMPGGAPVNNNQGGGGGAGGSYTSKGGNGGDGDNGNGNAGTAANAQTAMKLRGGCPGQTGGDGGAANTGGKGGAGGGAVALLAMTSITLTNATINASGAGAAACASPRGGGGGGGSGGMIVVRAPAISATGAKLVANGGGGSSGTNNNAPGAAGNDPNPATPGVSALPVTGPGGAGTGNSGFSTASLALAGGPGNSGLGGGGGGGGGGYIEASVAATGAMASPAVTVVP